jgi:hydroxymethylbilane synthase
MIQAQLVADALAQRYPEHEFTLTPLTTHGDRHPSLRLSDSPREGVFVKDLERALLDGQAELAVHSAKDLPTLPTPGLTLAAFLPREDARDVLVARTPRSYHPVRGSALVARAERRRSRPSGPISRRSRSAAMSTPGCAASARVRPTHWSSPPPG